MSVAGSRAALCGGGMVGLIELRKPDSSLSVTEGLPEPGMMVFAENDSLPECCIASVVHGRDDCKSQLIIILFGNLPCMCDELSKPESNRRDQIASDCPHLRAASKPQQPVSARAPAPVDHSTRSTRWLTSTLMRDGEFKLLVCL